MKDEKDIQDVREGLVVVATITAQAGKEDLLREAFKTLIPIAQAEPGFIQYDLHESIDQPGRFVFYEIWRDQAALDQHANTAFAQAFRARTGDWIASASVETYHRIA